MSGVSDNAAGWPELPKGSAWTEVGMTQYILYHDGGETLAWWEAGDDGEMHLTDVKISPGPEAV